MKKIGFDTYANFAEVPDSAKPALFTNVSIGVDLDSEYQIKFLVDVERVDEHRINLSWSEDPEEGMALISRAEIGQYAALLQDYARKSGMSAAKAAKAVYVVPRQTGYR